MELALCFAGLVVGVLVVVGVWRPWRRALPVLGRFVVTLVSGETFEGLLKSSAGGVLVLVDAFALDGNSRMRVDGELFLDRSNVAYMQKPGGAL